ncbi:MAG: cytochrome P460 family protein [Pirellulales bacterium]|nr:cytochrome P460 family protein [Pirellulales bacterium]
MNKQRLPQVLIVTLFIALVTFTSLESRQQILAEPPADLGRPSSLPLPSTLSVEDYEALLFDFLNRRQYKLLGWIPDKRVRDTGPFINGKYYGTHPAVKIYYSPEIIRWLKNGKQEAIPDGAMIVKEQYEPPAVRYDSLDDDRLFEHLSSWTVMVKDSSGSHDGWFWSNPAKNQKVVDNHQYPFDHPISGFGIYCVRCHASTKSTGETNEYTFASLRNVEGFSGEPLLFRVDDSWRKIHQHEEPVGAAAPVDESNEILLAAAASEEFATSTHPRCSDATRPELCAPLLNQEFLRFFPSIKTRPREQVLHFPPITHDWVVRRPAPAQNGQPFVTSNQCMSCHAGLLEPFGPTMFFPTEGRAEYGAPGVHLSPYGEWRWTPMGLAGRDPIFHAQLESEIELMRGDFAKDPEQAQLHIDNLVEACLTCHGAMGKHQYRLDHGNEAAHFDVEDVMRRSTDQDATGENDWRYGSLARDGISCTICHQMQPREQPAEDHRHYLEFFLETSITGNIYVGNANELHGPFEDKEISPYSMEHALGFKPKHNPYIKSSQMCGTCHVVNLPIVDRPLHEGEQPDELIAAEQNPLFKKYHHHVEQATYLEWLNSEYENEFNPENPQARTCQDCHMSRDYHHDELGLHLERLVTRIAAIQDDTYPDAENLADHKELLVRLRQEGYARHNFRGLNVFLLEMFNQFDDVLGVRKNDFMTGSTQDIPHAIDDFMRQARNDVATLAVDARFNNNGQLVAKVDVQNKVGHRFPSGVGFRRAFIEFLVIEKPLDETSEERIVWSSGRTNELGVLIDADGNPLDSEFFKEDSVTNKQACQVHHEVIDSPQKVQIYETLLHSARHRYTTSFIHGSTVVKDNRLLPRGWKEEGPGPALHGEFLKATHPGPVAKNDPRYRDGSGSDEVTYRVTLPTGINRSRLMVRATLYYQAIPPYFLQSLFETAPHGPATQRLHYICSNIDLTGTPIEGWKLPVISATAEVKEEASDQRK